jgi:hypothetical protein
MNAVKQRRRILWSIGLVGVAMSCPAEQSLQGLMACRALTEAHARLDCLDRETALLAEAIRAKPPQPAAPPAPAVVSAPVAVSAAVPGPAAVPPALDATQQFGLPKDLVAQREVAAGTRAADVEQIHARLSTLSTAGGGLLVFTLDNGQVWKQALTSEELLLKPGDTVIISKGWLGSYALQTPSGRACKVRRVR